MRGRPQGRRGGGGGDENRKRRSRNEEEKKEVKEKSDGKKECEVGEERRGNRRMEK